MLSEKLQGFQDLVVWQKAHKLTLEVYKTTRSFPDGERFGLVSQVRRAAVSIPADIAEGFKRNGCKDKVHFYNIAQSSLEELRYYIILSEDLDYVKHTGTFLQDVDEAGRMLYALVNSTRNKISV